MNTHKAMQEFYKRLQQYDQSGFFLSPIRVFRHNNKDLAAMKVGLGCPKAHGGEKIVKSGGPFNLNDGYVYDSEFYLRFFCKANPSAYYSCRAMDLTIHADHNLETLLLSVLDGRINLIGKTNELLTYLLAETIKQPKPLEVPNGSNYGYF